MKRLLVGVLLVAAAVVATPDGASAASAASRHAPATGWSSLSTATVHNLDHPVTERARKRDGTAPRRAAARRSRKVRGRVVRRLPARFAAGKLVGRPGLVPALPGLAAAAPATGAAGAALPLPAAPGVTPTPTPEPEPGFEVPDLPGAAERSVAVRSREWSFTLSQPSVRAGQVRVEFDNSLAEDPHELDTRGAALAFGHTAPGARAVKTVTLAPGSYVLFCPLPQHEALGMKATLTVRP